LAFPRPARSRLEQTRGKRVGFLSEVAEAGEYCESGRAIREGHSARQEMVPSLWGGFQVPGNNRGVTSDSEERSVSEAAVNYQQGWCEQQRNRATNLEALHFFEDNQLLTGLNFVPGPAAQRQIYQRNFSEKKFLQRGSEKKKTISCSSI